jgi:hypothetical protein
MPGVSAQRYAEKWLYFQQFAQFRHSLHTQKDEDCSVPMEVPEA